MRSNSQALTRTAILLASITLYGCSNKVGISDPVSWSTLKGWGADSHQQLVAPLQQQCVKLERKSEWAAICQAAQGLQASDSAAVARFFRQHFQPHRVRGENRSDKGLITGYYEPLLQGSYVRTERFNYPLYKKPAALLKVKPEQNLLKVKDGRARGRMVNGRIAPFYSRAEIDGPLKPLAGSELLWVDNSDAAFFLHIQGSGIVQMRDGSVVGVGYADQNGHPYRAIGRDLIAMGEVEAKDMSLEAIQNWLDNNPSRAQALKNNNPSYIFFTLREDTENGPRGSLNVPLTAERSVAVDRSIIPLGSPIWLDTQLPGAQQPYRRLVFAQDTGGAINGPVRADLFFGRGERAKTLAGEMKQPGSLFVLLPK
ncbi:MAG: murein transglycosylase A [Pseudomonadales bacterium]